MEGGREGEDAGRSQVSGCGGEKHKMVLCGLGYDCVAIPLPVISRHCMIRL